MSLFRRSKKSGHSNSNSIFSAIIPPSDFKRGYRPDAGEHYFEDEDEKTRSYKKMQFWLTGLAVFLFALYLFRLIPAIVTSYRKHIVFVENEVWRRTECSDPTFFKKTKKLGSNLCDDVYANEELIAQSALYVSLSENMPFKSVICYACQCLQYVLYFEWIGEFDEEEDTTNQKRKLATPSTSWNTSSIFAVVFLISYALYMAALPLYYKIQKELARRQCLKECDPRISSSFLSSQQTPVF